MEATNKADQHKWVLFLEGGGECDSHESCANQVARRPALGSSKYFANKTSSSKLWITSPDPIENPLASSWNRIFLAYCSQDLWSGQRTNATAETFGLYFSGHLIVKEVVRYLITHKGL